MTTWVSPTVDVVRDNMGHVNISTSSIFLHTEVDARHDATNPLHSVNWRTPHVAGGQPVKSIL
jgi:hypothetical protein